MTKPRPTSPQTAARRCAAKLLTLYLERGPSGRLPSRDWLAGWLHVGEGLLDQANTLLVAEGKINRLGHGRSLTVELIGTPFTLRLAKNGSDSKTGPAIYAVEGDSRGSEATVRLIERCTEAGVTFEDAPQACRPERRIRMTRPHDFSLTGATL